MRKIFGFLFLMVIIISGCEKDDFCIKNPVTPKLILRFYDDADRSTIKTADDLYVWSGTKDSIFENISTDSLVIPLNTNTNQTIYSLSKGDVVEQFTIDYTPENEYVSRSCGYKIIFNNVSFTTDNSWITDFTQIETAIDNQNTAHVQVFH
ncbi:hypothetical protein BW723_11605 [Polaribacter reichenbachii]|uniref:Uncharacterized protein n=1 Tax=Polaribacter reichenbachii TaxID=996801 RepID=A0A1B8TPP8_9FLAO|nr:DUF6452 family protein [Polaribacter reichenbachii]APZ46888.1 hypothetical protein BW723_11605 [Polaribacter reichenbachii]AUC17531.1 hypothetical protein BTO17_02050 [Polaribacter reichenbachii]OBY61595.1 hypothetical protein LPB301_16170 [Polaribacter reichenbachii]